MSRPAIADPTDNHFHLLLVSTPRPTSIPAGTGLAPIGDIEPCHTPQRSGIGVRHCYLPLNFTGIKYTYRPLSLIYYDVRVVSTYYNDIVVFIISYYCT